MMRSVPLVIKVILIYLAWASLWALLQAFIIHRFGFDWNQSLIDASVSQLILAIVAFSINRRMLSFQPALKNTISELITILGLSVFCVFIQHWSINELNSSGDYQEFFDRSKLIRWPFNTLMLLFSGVITWSWAFFRDQKESIKRKEDAERLAREAELANLRQQLQPHFLFNSLNSISALVGSQPELARSMIQQLSHFLRGTLKKDEKQLITLKEELAHLKLYLEIEKVRFGHRLETNIHVGDENLSLTLPSLLLQPIMENAIKFGLYDTLENIEINLSTRSENSYLIIEVKNPFDPSTASPKKGTGFGLQSVDRRLFLVYGQSNLLSVNQAENTFITTLKIPQSA